MNDIYERFNRWIDKLQETEVETEREEPQSELHEKITSMLSWVIRRIVPLLWVMLAIELLIIFASPVEIAMSRWFWLKDPIAIATAILLFRLPQCFSRPSHWK